MSVNLPVEHLRSECTRIGTTPYLLSQGDDGRPHAVAVTLEWQGDLILCSSGNRSARNVEARPLVSLLWPPREAGGYSLIVDGTGAITGEGASRRIVVTPTRGVLHRPGTPATPSPSGCGSDCVPLLG